MLITIFNNNHHLKYKNKEKDCFKVLKIQVIVQEEEDQGYYYKTTTILNNHKMVDYFKITAILIII